MIRKVYKYLLPYEDAFTLELPRHAHLLHVDVQEGRPCLWALVDVDAPKEPRHFRLAGTGHPITGNVLHVGTCLSAGGVLVWHLFELPDERRTTV